MRAVIVEHLGEVGSLREVPVPEPKNGEVLVRITAAGVNPVDWKTRDRGDHPMPFVLGQDFAGIVVSTGPNAHKYDIDERVFGIARAHGSYAEYTIVPEDDDQSPICKIPDDVGDADAAALPTAGLTALASLEALGVKQGTRLAILGVTGGVGQFAAQMARARGASVTGTGSSSHEAVGRDLGVDRYIAYDKGDVFDALAKEEPFDAVLDLVDGAETTARVKPAVKDGGAIVSTIGALSADDWSDRNIRAQNLVMFKTPQSSHAGLRELARLVEDGTLRVNISAERDLRDAAQALEQSKAGGIDGKLVLTVETGTI